MNKLCQIILWPLQVMRANLKRNVSREVFRCTNKTFWRMARPLIPNMCWGVSQLPIKITRRWCDKIQIRFKTRRGMQVTVKLPACHARMGDSTFTVKVKPPLWRARTCSACFCSVTPRGSQLYRHQTTLIMWHQMATARGTLLLSRESSSAAVGRSA